MGVVYKHEMRVYVKSLMIWVLCVGGMGFACILLFSSMQGDMEQMAENFASMGAFADAFGMSQISIATLSGFYAAEVGTIHSLGGAMFAAIVSTNMLSKEEDGHTSEFLFSLPVARGKVVIAKWCAMVSHIVLFNVLCVLLYVFGIVMLRESIPQKEYLLYHTMQVVMQIEVGTICYVVSAASKRNRLGAGFGIVLLLYAYDLVTRVIPDLSDYKVISPFSYANASEVLSGEKISLLAVVIGLALFIVCFFAAYICFTKKDLQ